MTGIEKADGKLTELNDDELDEVQGGLFEGCYKYENKKQFSDIKGDQRIEPTLGKKNNPLTR